MARVFTRNDMEDEEPASDLTANETGSNEDYKVGYKKPPKETQIQKGTSGNPRGRPAKVTVRPKRPEVELPGYMGALVGLLEKKVPIPHRGKMVMRSGNELIAHKLFSDLLGEPADRMRVVKMINSQGYGGILEALEQFRADLDRQSEITPELEAEIEAIVARHMDVPANDTDEEQEQPDKAE